MGVGLWAREKWVIWNRQGWEKSRWGGVEEERDLGMGQVEWKQSHVLNSWMWLDRELAV